MGHRRHPPLLTGLLWGTAYPAVKVALRSFEPLQIAVIRVVVSAVLLGVGQRDVFRIDRDELRAIAAIFYLLASRHYTNRLDLSPLTITFYMIAMAVPVLVGALLVSGDATVGSVAPIPGLAMVWLAVVVTVSGLAIVVGIGLPQLAPVYLDRGASGS